MKLLVTAVVILVVHNLHGNVFPAKAINDYEDTLAIMWEVLDADKDGSISASELTSADTDADGAVSLDELLEYTNKYIDDVEVDLQQEDAKLEQQDTNIEGTYQIRRSESGDDNFTLLELAKDGDGHYSATLSYDDQSTSTNDVVVSGNEFTFKIKESYEEVGEFELTWKCTINDGELSVEFTELHIESWPTITLQGSPLDETELQQAGTSIKGTFEMTPPIEGVEGNATLELTRESDDEYSAKISFKDQSMGLEVTVNGTEVAVVGNKCTFETSFRYGDLGKFILNWECTNNGGELTVEITPIGIESPAVFLKGKLLADE